MDCKGTKKTANNQKMHQIKTENHITYGQKQVFVHINANSNKQNADTQKLYEDEVKLEATKIFLY